LGHDRIAALRVRAAALDDEHAIVHGQGALGIDLHFAAARVHGPAGGDDDLIPVPYGLRDHGDRRVVATRRTGIAAVRAVELVDFDDRVWVLTLHAGDLQRRGVLGRVERRTPSTATAAATAAAPSAATTAASGRRSRRRRILHPLAREVRLGLGQKTDRHH